MSDEVPRRPPPAGNEVDTLPGGLERQRRALAWKCANLNAAGLRARIGASNITLGGLLKHVAWVEEDMFSLTLWGWEPSPRREVNRSSDPDWAWNTAANDSPDYLYGLWRAAASQSRKAIRKALADGGLDRPAAITWPEGTPTLRRLLIDNLEEYARHAGHADLIREAIDGRVGEGPPASFVIE